MLGDPCIPMCSFGFRDYSLAFRVHYNVDGFGLALSIYILCAGVCIVRTKEQVKAVIRQVFSASYDTERALISVRGGKSSNAGQQRKYSMVAFLQALLKHRQHNGEV